MRIDKFLKVSRLIKRREIAKRLCDDGDVLLDGKVAKPSSEVVEGSRITLLLGKRKIEALVHQTSLHASKEQAKELVEIISNELQS